MLNNIFEILTLDELIENMAELWNEGRSFNSDYACGLYIELAGYDEVLMRRHLDVAEMVYEALVDHDLGSINDS